MPYNPDIHHRRSIRLQGYDYSREGMYFVTICTHNREWLFGDIVNDKMCLNDDGEIVRSAWLWLAEQYVYVELDAWVIMPNHLHGIIVITNTSKNPESSRGGSRTAQENIHKRKPLGSLIGAFKMTATKHINQHHNVDNRRIWQRNFYEHIIRNEKNLNIIRKYVHENPSRWASDSLYADPK